MSSRAASNSGSRWPALSPRSPAWCCWTNEPFSSLDADLRDTTRRAVAGALSAAGVTTILVTHDRAEALAGFPRRGHGRRQVGETAAPADLHANPVGRTVAALVGSVVVLPATVADWVAECAPGRIPLAAAGAPPGSATVLLRPEQIVIGPAGDGVQARVLDVEFHGHDALVDLAIDDGVRVTSRCPGAARPGIGERVGLTVRGRAGLETTGDPAT